MKNASPAKKSTTWMKPPVVWDVAIPIPQKARKMAEMIVVSTAVNA